MADEFSDKLIAFAKRNINSAERCTNEESTKMFLVLPFVNFLGYDDRNPHEVCPEHAADFSDNDGRKSIPVRQSARHRKRPAGRERGGEAEITTKGTV